MMQIHRFSVPGPPPGKPRMTRRDRWDRRPSVVRYREWCDAVRRVAGKIPPAETVTDCSWSAWFAPPKSWSRRRAQAALGCPHRGRPDRDNIDKALLDALWPKGDSAIARGTIEKRWGEPSRLDVTICFE